MGALSLKAKARGLMDNNMIYISLEVGLSLSAAGLIGLFKVDQALDKVNLTLEN